MRDLSIPIFLALLNFSLSAQAQVYQSTDEQGNVTFSDQPTPDSKKIVVPEPNVGDSVEVPPPAPVVEPEPEPEPAAQELPANLEGELDGVEKKDNGSRRPRKEPRGGS
jgi:hypothetical protein